MSYRIKIKNVRGDEDVPYANENILVCLCTKNIILLKSFLFLTRFFELSPEKFAFEMQESKF